MEDVMGLESIVASIVSETMVFDEKVAAVCDELWEALVSQLDSQMCLLAEDLVCARIDFPERVEFVCRVS